MAVSEMEIIKQEEVDDPAVFMGVLGWAEWDAAGGRLVFQPDGDGLKSAAYQRTVRELGCEWNEWVFEVAINLRRQGDLLIIGL